MFQSLQDNVSMEVESYGRALELLDLTIEITKDKNRLKEYLRLREMMAKFYLEKKGNLKFNSQLFAITCTLSKDV